MYLDGSAAAAKYIRPVLPAASVAQQRGTCGSLLDWRACAGLMRHETSPIIRPGSAENLFGKGGVLVEDWEEVCGKTE